MVDAYIGTRALLLSRGSQALLAQPVDGVEQGLQRLETWLNDEGGALKLERTLRPLRLRLWLSGGLCRPFVFTPPPGIRSHKELQQVAAASAGPSTGLTGACEVWMDEQSMARVASGARVVVAMQTQLLRRIQKLGQAEPAAGRTTAKRNRHTVVSLRPWWAEHLQASLQANPKTRAVAAQDCDALTVLTGDGASSNFQMATTLTPIFDRDAADAALMRMLLLSSDLAPADDATQAEGVVMARLCLSVREDFGDVDSGVSAGTYVAKALRPFLEFSR